MKPQYFSHGYFDRYVCFGYHVCTFPGYCYNTRLSSPLFFSMYLLKLVSLGKLIVCKATSVSAVSVTLILSTSGKSHLNLSNS